MSIKLESPLLAGAFALTLSSAAAADVPRIAADIAPVHGLVARVMDGLGEPALIVQPGTSPHDYAMRPSEAAALQEADAVFWIGSALEPWLDGAIETLAADARIIELLDVPGITTLEFREGAVFDDADHDHGHGDDHAEEEGHDEDGDHAHDDHDGHDHDGHDHEGTDPHAWLDPENAKIWIGLIADELAALDPENAETYRANAAAGQDEIDRAVSEVRSGLAAAGEMDFVVFHDAYHYFENRFGISAAGAIALSDASDPGPARIEEVRARIASLGVDCVFSEPQFDQKLVNTVTEGTSAQPAVIDPLGFDIAPGADFYPALLRTIGTAIGDCAS